MQDDVLEPEITSEGRILLVDDSREFAASVADSMSSRGYEVEVTHGVKNAEDKAKDFNPEVAIVDIRLKESSGIDLIPKLRQICPNIVIVIMTGHASVDNAIDALHKGAYAYLRKPVEIMELFTTIGHCFEKLRLERESATAREALRENEEKYRLLVNSLVNPLTVYGADGRISFMNAAGANNFGVELEQAVGKYLHDFFPKDIADIYVKRARHVFESGEGIQVEDEAPLPSGSRWFCSDVQPLKDSSGKVTAVHTISYDVTERRKAEEVLRESEEKYRTLVEGISEAVFKLSLPDIVYEYVSLGSLAVTGYSAEKFMSTPGLIKEIIHPDSADYFEEKYAQVLRGEVSPTYEFKIIDPEGNNRWLLQSNTGVYDDEGNLIGIEGVCRNITERKEADEQLEASLKEKEVLLQEIHHRVKNNLQVISSLLSLQSQAIEDKQSREVFAESQSRVKAMALVHEQLYQSKDFSRIECDEYLQKMVSNLFYSYGVNRDIIAPKIEAKDVFLDISTAIPCGLIVSELVSNSLKYAFPSDRKGEIRIAVDGSEGRLTLVVSDDGVGLPKDLDFQETSSLGLRLVNILTRQLGGTIEIDRTRGTEFRITFAC